MEIYEKMKAWLEGLGFQISVEQCGKPPGSAGLYFLGQKELKTREDLLGNRFRKVRYQFLLRLVMVPEEPMLLQCLQMCQEAPKVGIRISETAHKKEGSTGLYIYHIRLDAEREETI